MRKIKDLYLFLKELENNKKRLKCIGILIGTFFEFPAFVFHEFMHIIFMVQWNVFNIKINDSWFYEVIFSDPKNNNKPSIRTFGLSMNYASTPLAGLLTSAAPLIGWFLLLYYSIMFNHWFLLSYLILGFRMFFLSREDIKAMRSCGCNRKLFRMLWIINFVLQKNKNFKL